MKKTSGKRLQRIFNTVLILVVMALAARVSTRYSAEYDWTYGNRNTLSSASQQQLAQMPDDIRFLVFDYPGSNARREIEAYVARYQRVKANVRLDFIDPGAEPVKARDYGITQPGEAVLEYQGRHESLSQMSEQAISTVLQRLADATERYVLFLQGHGERGLEAVVGKTQYDLSQLKESLTEKGLKVLALNLVSTPKIPENASALVIATPTQTLLDSEIERIKEYVESGGNLMWLADPDYPAGMETIQTLLGVRWLEGSVIFANYQKVGARSPVEFFATSYPPNAVTQSFRNLTSFPLSRAIEFDTPKTPKAAGWTYVPVVQTGDDAWLESGKLDGEVTFSAEKGDILGPVTIGLTMTRDVAATETQAKRVQRVALFGDGDFMSDLMLQRHGNKQLATILLQWISSRDAQIAIDVPKAPDVSLNLPPWAFWLYGAGFTVIIPLLLLAFGVGRWLIRRRQ
ncbi:Gldg family protein [Nevskia sp.]|uniref:GldG family protein n=1 Tax=Nevskia sp. TaxID=1929292 RepID=UPI0025D7A745|nr:Gldg family protein [Nevskia sp.]